MTKRLGWPIKDDDISVTPNDPTSTIITSLKILEPNMRLLLIIMS
jgi:hypothetical protein